MEPEKHRHPVDTPDFVYREDGMKALLSDADWKTYCALDLETQVCVAHLVTDGKSFQEALLFLGLT